MSHSLLIVNTMILVSYCRESSGFPGAASVTCNSYSKVEMGTNTAQGESR